MNDAIMNFGLLNFDALDAELKQGRVLKPEEARYIFEYLMRHSGKREELLMHGGYGSCRTLRDTLWSRITDLAAERFPDPEENRFTWRFREDKLLGEPVILLRNDQTDLNFYWYRPEKRDWLDLQRVLDRCVRGLFKALGVREEVTDLYLAQDHQFFRFSGHAEPEDAWLELAFYNNPRSAVAYNLQIQTAQAVLMSGAALPPETRSPRALLSRVLHRLTGRDPEEPGAVFVRRRYVLEVRLDIVEDQTEDDPEHTDYQLRPIEEMRETTRQRLLEGGSVFGLILPPEEIWTQRIEIDACRTFYALHSAIRARFGWKDYWNHFSDPGVTFSTVDEDLYLPGMLDQDPAVFRQTRDTLLIEYFETHDECRYYNCQFACSVKVLARKDVPLRGMEGTTDK